MADGWSGGRCRGLANFRLAGKSRQLVDGPAVPPDPRGLRGRSGISLRFPADSEPARLNDFTVCTLRRSHGPRRLPEDAPPGGFSVPKGKPPGNVSFRCAITIDNHPVFIFRFPRPGPMAVSRFQLLTTPGKVAGSRAHQIRAIPPVFRRRRRGIARSWYFKNIHHWADLAEVMAWNAHTGPDSGTMEFSTRD